MGRFTRSSCGIACLLTASITIFGSFALAHASEWMGPETSTNEMTDIVSTVIEIDTDNSWSGVLGTETHGQFLVRCRSGKTEAWFDAQQVLKSDWESGTIAVSYRFDDAKAVVTRWHASDSSTAAFIPNPIDFLTKLIEHDRLRIEVPWQFPTTSPRWVGSITLPSETREKVEAIAQTCKWKLPGQKRTQNDPKSERCRRESDCTQFGKCTAKDAVCIAATDEDCRRSHVACIAAGNCTARDGACSATSDKDCRRASLCRDGGRCRLKDGECVPTPDDCRKSTGCKVAGLCTFDASSKSPTCKAMADDCRSAEICATNAFCTAVNGVCTISDQDCKAWNGCKMLGRCSFVNGDCAAKDDGDCARSAACQHAGLCRAANGSCTKN